MVRYINYDDLIKKWHDLGFDEISKIHKINALNHFIKNLPTADVVEVKHGYWYEIDSDVGWELVGCSICRGEYSLCEGEDKTDYCPYCGAKMDGNK